MFIAVKRLMLAMGLLCASAQPLWSAEWIAIGHAIGIGAKWPAVLRAQAALNGIELKLLHIQRGDFRPDFKETFRAEDFDETLTFSPSDSMHHMLDQLARYRLRYPIITGVEGIDWPFALNEQLGLPTLSQADAQTLLRKELFYSYLTRPEFGIDARALRVANFNTQDDPLPAIRAAGLDYPIAIKPVNAASGYGFSGQLNTENDVSNYMKEWRNQPNVDGSPLTSFVAQPFFVGDHYAIQAIVRDHKMVVTDVFHHQKEGATYLQSTLLSGDDAIVGELIESHQTLMTSFQGLYMLHLEVVKDRRYGFVPYDCGPRAMGGFEHLLVKHLLGRHQMDGFARALLQPITFDRMLNIAAETGRPYAPVPFAAMIDWTHHRRGRVVNVTPTDELRRRFPTLVDIVAPQVNQVVMPTNSFMNAIGVSWFVSADPAMVERDIVLFREAERNGEIMQTAECSVDQFAGQK